MTDPFNYIKENTNIIEVAQLYGITVNKYNKAICPFHSDHKPSLSFKGRYFTCFVCGAKGSVIDLVMGLFELKPIEAVKKINADFALGLDLDKKDSYSVYIADEGAHLDLHEVRDGLNKWCDQKRIEYEKAVDTAMEDLKNMNPGDDLETRAQATVEQINRLCKCINVLESGSIEERLKLYRQLKGVDNGNQ